jgi:hypothetical protein
MIRVTFIIYIIFIEHFKLLYLSQSRQMSKALNRWQLPLQHKLMNIEEAVRKNVLHHFNNLTRKSHLYFFTLRRFPGIESTGDSAKIDGTSSGSAA